MNTAYVPFSHRYGIAAPEEIARWFSDNETIPSAEFWRVRHAICFQNDTVPKFFRCVCLGSPSRDRCSERASQEDRLCDACREHCVAVDDAGKYHRLVDVYGAAL